MNKFNLFWKTLLYTFIFIGIFNSALAKILEFNQDDKSISNYFSGIISFDNFDYKKSQVFFKKMVYFVFLLGDMYASPTTG